MPKALLQPPDSQLSSVWENKAIIWCVSDRGNSGLVWERMMRWTEMKDRCRKRDNMSQFYIWLWFTSSDRFLSTPTHNSPGVEPLSPPCWRIKSWNDPEPPLRAPESIPLLFVELLWISPGYPRHPQGLFLQSRQNTSISTVIMGVLVLAWRYFFLKVYSLKVLVPVNYPGLEQTVGYCREKIIWRRKRMLTLI